MPTITLDLPTAEELELVKRFTVNEHYLQALAQFVVHKYGSDEELHGGLKRALSSHAAYTKIERKGTNVDAVRRFLLLGWTSEIQLQLPATMGSEAIIGYANAWAPVHAYYTVFGGLQAWFAANGMAGTANNHTATLKTIANMIAQRKLLPEPWNLLAVGCPMRGERKHLNVPNGVDCTSHVEVLSIPAPLGQDPTFWARYGTWLRSTRAARLTAREDQWKKENKKKKIAPNVRTKLAESLSATSFFDCLWRLRIKSNYGNIDPYLVSEISPTDHVVFNRSLRTVTSATASLLELYVLRRIGKAEYMRIASEFITQDRAGLSRGTLQTRLSGFGL